MVTELTEQEIMEKSVKAIQENQEIKRVVNRVLWWLERGGDASDDHSMMTSQEVAAAARHWLKKEGIDLT